MKVWENFLVYIKPHISGCPDSMLLEYIKRAAIDFCAKSHVYVLDADPITVIADTDTYDLEFSGKAVTPLAIYFSKIGTAVLYETSEYELSHISETWQTDTGSPTHRFMTRDGKIRLWKTPTAAESDSLECEVIVKPTIVATGVDDFIFNEYALVINDNALFILKQMPERKWTDLQSASMHYQMYRRELSRIKGQIFKSRRLGPSNVAPQTFGGVD